MADPLLPTSPTGYLVPSLVNDFMRKEKGKTGKGHHEIWADNSSSGGSSSSSSSSSDESWDSEQEAYENQLQWEESIRQLQLLFSVVVLPFAAKWAGRKAAYWVFARYLTVGLGMTFWLGPLANRLAQYHGRR